MTNRVPRRMGSSALAFALAAAIAVALPLATFASGGDNGITKTVDGLSLELVVGSGAPRTGSNTVRLEESATSPGSYRGNVDLGFSGAWTASMEIERGDVKTMTDFALDVASGGPNWAIIGVFGGIVIVVIAAAAVLRSRRRTAQPAAREAA